ncbi:MAG TPA: hypothetical protein VNO70_03875 [Blastocatellia bacterium]|nr:hypothetical protein [Blastocatellia bacterium]
MPELIHQHTKQLQGADGKIYNVLVYGAPRTDGTWEGWLEFQPADGTLQSLRTERETSQPDRDALVYWATGLEPVYIEGAFERAH